MSNSVRPHRRQPTKLPRPWDSPGKNTGVDCHFLLQYMKVKSESEVAQSIWLFATPWTAAYQAPLSMGFSRQEYWNGLPFPSPKESNCRGGENSKKLRLQLKAEYMTELLQFHKKKFEQMRSCFFWMSKESAYSLSLFFFYFGHTVQHMGWFPRQGRNEASLVKALNPNH